MKIKAIPIAQMKCMYTNNFIYMKLCLFPALIADNILSIQVVSYRVPSLTGHFELMSGKNWLKGELTGKLGP